MTLNKLSWAFKRHPFLYKTRFKLLSKNSSVDEIQGYSYNKNNHKNQIPKIFKEVNEKIFESYNGRTELDYVKHLGIWLKKNIRGGKGLSESSDKALSIMLSGKGGVCSDIAQIFNNFCTINDIKVREWGNTRAPFCKNYGGHSFNEVFSKELNKWVLIDVYSSVFFYNNNNIPLSVIELFELVRKEENVCFESFDPDYIIDKDNIAENYFKLSTVPFLICNYSNSIYDLFLKYFKSFLPIFIIHSIIYIIGKSYHYKFPLDNYRKIFS